MATPGAIQVRFSRWVILLSFIISLTGCDYYNFEFPQPVDRKNIYEFPKKLLGEWHARDTFETSFDITIPVKGPSAGDQSLSSNPGDKQLLLMPDFNAGTTNEDDSYLRITKKYVQLIFKSTQRMVRGVWPRPDEKGELVYPGDYRLSDELEKQVIYDSLNRAVDTISNYLFFGNKVYGSMKNEYLRKGYPFYSDHDTVVIFKRDTIIIDLGQNAFLRKMDEKRYVFNFRNFLVGDDGDRFDDWWSLRVLEIVAPGKFFMFECASKSGELPSMFHAANSKSEIYYFNSQWTTPELSDIIRQGYLESTATYYRKK